MVEAMRAFIGPNQMMAYLVMMTTRLVELHQVLKPTGSIYLHCDPTASHYLKVMADAVFGYRNFLNEVIWYYRGAGVPRRERARRHDVLLWYAKRNGQHYFDPDPIRRPYAEATVKRFAHHIGNVRDGHDYGQQELHPLGKHPDDVITHIQPIAPSAKARLGYPTQKPVRLLEELIESSSRARDLVLDPFCGCGTTVVAAQKLDRRWIGVDITHLAIALQKYRLRDSFALTAGTDYTVIGEPQDLAAAQYLAEQDRFQFEAWALSLIHARPAGGQKKKGADKGIDGVIRFIDGAKGKAKRVLVQVKSGSVGSRDIRDLVGTVDREKADIGVFITLEKPTRPMKTEAISAGFYHSPSWHKEYPRIQILTIEELLNGATVQMPPQAGTFKEAQVDQGILETQGKLGI